MENPFSDEVIMAYVDGELPPDQHAAVAAEEARNPVVQESIALFSGTRRYATAFNPVLVMPLSGKLAALRDELAPMPRSRPQPSSASGWLKGVLSGLWTPTLSPAAAIPVVAVAIAVGWMLSRTGNSELTMLDDRGLVASASLQVVLDRTPSNTTATVGGGTVKPIATFANAQGVWCRQYAVTRSDGRSSGGVACLDQNVWKVIAMTPPTAPQPAAGAGKMIPAGSDALLNEIATAVKDGDALDEARERQVIGEHWRNSP